MRRVLITCVIAACCLFIGAQAGNPTAGNTPLSLIDVLSGYVDVTSAGVGFGGTDATGCVKVVPGTINLPWGFSGVTVRKAYLFYQASTNGNETTFWATLEGVKVVSEALTSGKVCSQKLAKSYGLRAEVTSIVKAKLEGTGAATVPFAVTFENECKPTSTERSLANGMSLLVVYEQAKVIPYGTVQIQAGAFGYDVKFNKDAMTALFTVPMEGVNAGLRASSASIDLYSFIGESENFPTEVEGFYVNGAAVDVSLDGNSGQDWENNKLDVTPYLANSATQLNITLFSSMDCHIFVGMVLQYEINDPNSNGSQIIEDPHAKTWDGAHVTLFAEGDFLLVESASFGVAVHGRFCKSKRGPWAPWTCAMAIRCSHDESFLEIDARSMDVFIGDSSATLTHNQQRSLTVACPSGLTVHMVRSRFHRHSYMNARLSGAPADARGLLGTPNGNAADDFQYRDGRIWTPVAHSTHYIGHAVPELGEIQESWRLTSSEQTFSTEFVAATGSAPIVSAAQRSRHTKSATASCKAAGIKSSKFMAMCIHDAVATGSVEAVRSLANWFRSS